MKHIVLTERKVKENVKKLLAMFGISPASKAGAFPEDSYGWYFMPAQSGMGVSGIPDFIGKYKGRFFAVETKAPGKKPTGFQKLQIDAINTTPGPCFVIDGDVAELEEWLKI